MMNALEKLGYKLLYRCDEKYDTDYGLIIYENDNAYIIYERACGWYKVASRTYKQEDEKQLAFDDDEILALAEVIKEKENGKMKLPTKNEDILIAKRIVNAIVHGNVEITGAIMVDDANGKYDTLITIMDEAIEIFEKAKKAIKENK